MEVIPDSDPPWMALVFGKYAEYNYSFDLCRTKGAFAVRNTDHHSWSYYLVD